MNTLNVMLMIRWKRSTNDIILLPLPLQSALLQQPSPPLSYTFINPNPPPSHPYRHAAPSPPRLPCNSLYSTFQTTSADPPRSPRSALPPYQSSFHLRTSHSPLCIVLTLLTGKTLSMPEPACSLCPPDPPSPQAHSQ